LSSIENHLISSLPRKDRARLLAICEPVQLVLGDVLCDPGQPTRYVYFPTQGFISLLASIDGLEVCECFHSLQAWDFQRSEFVSFHRAACSFGYRDSLFKQQGWHLNGRLAIVSVVFRLAKRWQANIRYADVAQELAAHQIATPTAQGVAAAITAIRQRKLPDPAITPNAGSFFHNPVVERQVAEALAAEYPALPRYPQPDGRVKLAAGWLIEQAGWKGKALGAAGMYDKQALVLVNRGGATGADVRRLMAAVQADVRARFAVELSPEPIFL
jgi:UDP-N-acetylmuramate dehydrogenase